MDAMRREEVLAFYEALSMTNHRPGLAPFRTFLVTLFEARQLDGCSFFTSHWTFCIVRYPVYEEWRFKPQLLLDYPYDDSLRMQLRIFTSLSAVVRVTTYESRVSYQDGLSEFDSMYRQFIQAHGEVP